MSYQPKVKKYILNIKIEKYYAQFVQSKYHHIEKLQYIQILDMYSALQGVCVWIATEILHICGLWHQLDITQILSIKWLAPSYI